MNNEITSISELLNQYKNTLKKIREIKQKIQKELDYLENIYNNHRENEVERQRAKEKTEPLLLDKSIVNSWESNLLYSIKWMKTGRRPDSRRGAERRAAYERETPFEPYWIQRRKDSCESNLLELFNEEDEQSKKHKENLVIMMTSCLTDRQKDILELSGNGYSHEEIAKLLGVHKGTISRTIARAKEKIEDEGWFMV